jgi:hypothetical protein
VRGELHRSSGIRDIDGVVSLAFSEQSGPGVSDCSYTRQVVLDAPPRLWENVPVKYRSSIESHLDNCKR